MRIPELEKFEQQARAILTLLPPVGRTPQVIEHMGGRIVVADYVDCPAGFHLRESLVVRGRFACGTGSIFAGPVYCGGDFSAGKGSRFEAVSAGGRMTLGPGVRVEQVAHSRRQMELRAGAWVGEAVSEEGIRLGQEAGGGRLFAPEMETLGRLAELDEGPPVSSYYELGPPHAGGAAGLDGAAGFRRGWLSALGEETWVYEGNLNLRLPLLLRAKLVVRGWFRCVAGSLLEEDVKSGGTLHVGAGSICRGDLISLSGLTLDEGCLFAGRLKARGELRLCAGVRGFRRDGPVEVASGAAAILEPNVVVRGRLSAGAGVRQQMAEAGSGLDQLRSG